MSKAPHILAIIALCALAGCSSQENATIAGFGWANFTLNVDESPVAPPDAPFSLTLSTIDGDYTHTWPDISEYSEFEQYYAGDYVATAMSGSEGDEGYGCPCYVGTSRFAIAEKARADVSIDCSLWQAIVNPSMGTGIEQAYPEATLTLHTQRYGYPEVDNAAPSPLLIAPGKTHAYVTIDSPDGSPVTLAPGFAIDTEHGATYDIAVDLTSDHYLTISSGDTQARMLVTDELFASEAPYIQAEGFTPGQMLNLSEGYPAENPVKMIVKAEAGLQALTLTAIGHGTPDLSDVSAEFDMLEAPSQITDQGIKVDKVTDNEAIIDFSTMLESMSVIGNAEATLTVQALDKLNRATAPMTLRVGITSVEVEVRSVSQAMIGINEAHVELLANIGHFDPFDFTFCSLDHAGRPEELLPVTEISAVEMDQAISFTINVGQGVLDVPIGILYMGNLKATAIVTRAVPLYDITIDAFATSATVMIMTSDTAVARAITRYASITVNGDNASIMSRDPQDATIKIANLKPSTNYTFSSVVLADGYAPTTQARTEDDAQVPSGDFEDADVIISEPHMPSGGVYSNTSFPIFNVQNYADIEVYWPQKHWASVNAKTYCNDAANHNTWYMQPSSAIDYDYHAAGAGSKSVRVSSVGWSLDGPDIEPYAQEPGERLPYNCNVPDVQHRATGRLFLGSYTFDPVTCKETYVEGVAFNSRPSSLNGYYRYVPDATAFIDYGYVRVEIVNNLSGDNIVIGSGEMQLAAAPDFITFNLPITYYVDNVKATKLRIMFCSSYHFGTIEEEDLDVSTTQDIANACYRGSTLWVDNLSFSY